MVAFVVAGDLFVASTSCVGVGGTCDEEVNRDPTRTAAAAPSEPADGCLSVLLSLHGHVPSSSVFDWNWFSGMGTRLGWGPTVHCY